MLSEALLENEREVVLSQTSRHEDESFLDVLIHLDDGSTVKMHSLVLAASSELFQSIGQVRGCVNENTKNFFSFMKHKYAIYSRFYSYNSNYSDTNNTHKYTTNETNQKKK